MVMQLSQDLTITFILSFGLGVAAILFSYYNFRVSRARTSKSEQIKISRDLWEHITEKFDKIQEIANTKEWNKIGQKDVELKDLWTLVREINYFAYLILIGEIKDDTVLNYYKKPLSDYVDSILRYYTPPNQRDFLYEDYEYFDKLITKWKINRPVDQMT